MLGNDQYPLDLTQAFGMLVNYKTDKSTKLQSDSVPTSDDDEGEEDMAFLQYGKKSIHNSDNSNKAISEQYSPSHSYQQAIALYVDAHCPS